MKNQNFFISNFLNIFIMALIEKFEDMLSWKKALKLNKIIYSETNNQIFTKDFALKDQIRKSSISVMSNIAERFERNNKKEFRYFLSVAKGSAGELRSQLYVAKDLDYITESVFNLCYDFIIEISKLIRGFIEKLNIAIAKELLEKSKLLSK
jgi:four helix bundle protein